jgi:hypothetical protein
MTALVVPLIVVNIGLAVGLVLLERRATRLEREIKRLGQKRKKGSVGRKRKGFVHELTRRLKQF